MGFDRRRTWMILLAAVLGFHAALSLSFPEAGWTTSAGVGANLLLAVALCLFRARDAEPEMRWRWLTLTSAFALWIAAYASIAYTQSVLMADTSRALLFGLLYTLRGVPFLLLLARSGDTDDGRVYFRIDSAQAVLFAALAVVLLFPAVISGGGPNAPFVPDSLAIYYHDAQNFGLALLSIAALVGQPAGERRRFARALCAVLAVYAPTAALGNSLIGAVPAPPPGSIANMLGDVPPAVLVIMASGPRLARLPARPDTAGERLFRLLLPAAFCAASLAASVAVASRYPVLGTAAAATGLALYTLRSSVLLFQLRQLQLFVTEVVERLPDAICVVGKDGLVLLGNGAASQLFDADVKGAEFTALLAGLGTVGEGGEIDASDGRTWLIAEAPIAAGGRIIRLSDITHIRGAEREREETLQFLSHDMRSPVAGIVRLLEGRDPADLASASPDLLDRVRRYARRGLAMADDFVRLARLNNADTVRLPVELGDAAAEAADIVWPNAKERQVTLVPDPGVEAWVLGDRALLIRAIHNLLDNGVKFAPAGSVLRYGVSVADGVARFHVTGPGPDIPPERMANMFQPFGARQAAARLDGVGLGLAFVNVAIERQGGAVGYRALAGNHIFSIEFAAISDDADDGSERKWAGKFERV